MADNSLIEWTDATWQPITGCSVVSPGCKHCYAMKLAGGRLRHHPTRAGLTQTTKAGPVWTGEVRFNEKQLLEPLGWSRPRKIFVCAHGDLFAEGVPDEWIDQVFAVMALCPQHVFQVLTKRPERMRAYLSTGRSHPVALDALGLVLDEMSRNPRSKIGAGVVIQGDMSHLQSWPLPNVWLGVSVENQYWAVQRICDLLETPAAKRFISAEPLLGPLDLEPFLNPASKWSNGWHNNYPFAYPRAQLDWVIAGGESGPGARPMHPDWARSLRDQCAAAGIAFFFKQWGGFAPSDPVSAIMGTPKHRRGSLLHRDGHVITDVEMDRLLNDETFDLSPFQQMIEVGKRSAGRLLDGVEHNGMPSGGGPP
jgi:protein gp37